MFGLLIRRIDRETMGMVTFALRSNSSINKDIHGRVFYPKKNESFLISIADNKDEGSLIIVP